MFNSGTVIQNKNSKYSDKTKLELVYLAQLLIRTGNAQNEHTSSKNNNNNNKIKTNKQTNKQKPKNKPKREKGPHFFCVWNKL